MGEFLLTHGGELIWGAIAGVLSWIAVGFIAQPILGLREKRLDALRIAERYAYFEPSDSEERVRNVRREIFDAASALIVQVRGGSKLIRLYCKTFGYDLEEAAGALRGIGNMAGEHYPEEIRRNNLSHVYVKLGASDHLSADALAAYRKAIGAEALR